MHLSGGNSLPCLGSCDLVGNGEGEVVLSEELQAQGVQLSIS